MAGPTTFNELLSKQSSSLLRDPNYWRSLCPCARISCEKDGPEDDRYSLKDSRAKDDDTTENNDNKKKISSSMISEGYALTDFIENHSSPHDKKKLKQIFVSLRETIKTLSSQNFPATMILLYDETWQLARYASKLLTSSTSTRNAFNFDILAWHLNASSGDVGFGPHRDRQPENTDVASTFHSDGHAKYVTLWLALSDAHPENSCLYVIPKRYDPGYHDGDDDDDDDDDDDSKRQDPLRKALPDKGSYQNIRAIPRQAGQGVMFTHRIMHWGSRGNPSCTDPRIAISFVASDPTFEKPYLVDNDHHNYFDKNNNNGPPFEVRLLLACSQLLTYYQRFNLSRGVIKTCYEYCKERERLLEESYRKKVFLEFVKAMKETNDETTTGGCVKGRQQQQQQQQEMGRKRKHDGHDDNNDGDNSDDEDDELVLEEMLNAEAEGYGDFEDDYDDLEGQHDDDDLSDGCDDDDLIVDKDFDDT